MGKYPDFTQSRTQAIKSVKLCLENASEFVKDSEIWIDNERHIHLPLLLQFAAEDCGKARILLEKLKENTETIKIESKKDKLFDHETKSNTISSEIDIPEDRKMLLSIALGDDPTDYFWDPIVIAKIESERKELKEQIKNGHQDRTDCSFVNFDFKTGEPYLGHNRTRNDMWNTLNAIKTSITNLRKDLAVIESNS